MGKNRNRNNNQSSNPLTTQQEATMAITENQDPTDQQQADGEQTQEPQTDSQQPTAEAQESTTVTTLSETPADPQPTASDAPAVQEPSAESEVTSNSKVIDLGTQDAQTPPPEPTANVAPVVNVTTAPVKEAVATNGELDAIFKQMLVNGTSAEKGLVNALESYLRGMAPGTIIDADVGARHQYNLWQALRNVVQSSPDGEFNRLWNMVLAFAHQHRQGVFGDRYVFRFSESWRYDLDELDAFQRLLNLINLTANQAEREKGLRNVDLTRSLDKGFNEHGRARLVSFYK